eukprot:gene16-26_t
MDDGSLQAVAGQGRSLRGSFVIATDSYRLLDMQVIQTTFEELYGIRTTLQEVGISKSGQTQYRLYIGA